MLVAAAAHFSSNYAMYGLPRSAFDHDQIAGKTWAIAITLCRLADVQTRPTTDTMACYAAAPALLPTVDACLVASIFKLVPFVSV